MHGTHSVLSTVDVFTPLKHHSQSPQLHSFVRWPLARAAQERLRRQHYVQAALWSQFHGHTPARQLIPVQWENEQWRRQNILLLHIHVHVGS